MGIAACSKNDCQDGPNRWSSVAEGRLQSRCYHNRTRSTAEKLAKHFPSDYNIILVDSLETSPSGAPSAIVPTAPATAVSLEPATGKIYVIPALLESKSGGIIVDMAYRPAPTPLIRLARSVSRSEWHATEGNGGFWEQGYRQFRAWTTMKASQDIIRRMVCEKYH
ncbi:hypothetical protein M422DRAFT_32678 [Sphaerobolus stellatus SS14]|uniref:Uncharacterized protein n=1 Tax=Sphaerobolus stellatus (strain SS14) TaxID=990650 RepID=A0A0C9VNU9_SPHS4|nr:hypothetical protein M422DRAFT_32678 [Sphaerobolus stellatus SS14]